MDELLNPLSMREHPEMSLLWGQLPVDSEEPACPGQCCTHVIKHTLLHKNGSPVRCCRGVSVCEFSGYRKSLFYFPCGLECMARVCIRAARYKVESLKRQWSGNKTRLPFVWSEEWHVVLFFTAQEKYHNSISEWIRSITISGIRYHFWFQGPYRNVLCK